MSKNPPAFPHKYKGIDQSGSKQFYLEAQENASGMTLRDYFAAKAMQSLIPLVIKSKILSANACRHTAGSAYEFAEAMLEARAKTESEET